jgi:molecular chaperone GrpE
MSNLHKDKRKKKEKKVTLPQSAYEEIVKKANERDEYFNKFLKAYADFDNFRKRSELQRAELIKFATEEVLLKIIPIVDNLDRAMGSLNNAGESQSVIKGIKLIQAQFHDLLSVNGVRRIETKDQIFNPQFHEAAESIEMDDLPEHTILEEIQPGYTLNGKVIKHAFVKVSKKKAQIDTDKKGTDEHRQEKE